MLDSKPAHYIKFWKLSSDEHGNEIIELISNDLKTIKLEGHYAFIWKLINGFRSVQEIISVFIQLFKENTPEELSHTVINSLKEMEEKELIIINWNPFN